MIVLASDMSALAPLVLIVPIAGILGAVSFFPAWRGHWAAPLLATPLLIVGGFAAFVLFANASQFRLSACLLLLLPLVMATSSLVLWMVRMPVRAAALESNPASQRNPLLR